MRPSKPAETDGQALFVRIAVPDASGAIWAAATRGPVCDERFVLRRKSVSRCIRAAFRGQAPRLSWPHARLPETHVPSLVQSHRAPVPLLGHHPRTVVVR